MVDVFTLFVHSLQSEDCEWYILLKNMWESDKDKGYFSGRA